MGRAHRRRQRHPRRVAGGWLRSAAAFYWFTLASASAAALLLRRVDRCAVRLRPARRRAIARCGPRRSGSIRNRMRLAGLRPRRRGGRARGRRCSPSPRAACSRPTPASPSVDALRDGAARRRADDGRPDRRRARLYRALRHAGAARPTVAPGARAGRSSLLVLAFPQGIAGAGATLRLRDAARRA